MVMTPKMFEIEQEIMRLRKRLMEDPDDHMASFEMDELVAKYDTWAKFEKLGLKVVLGGRHCKEDIQETDVKTS